MQVSLTLSCVSITQKDHFRCPTAIIVGAKELPRNAQVEAQLIYRTEFLEDEDAPHIVLCESRMLSDVKCRVHLLNSRNSSQS